MRSINKDLGTPVNRQLVMSRFAFKGIYFDNEGYFVGNSSDYFYYLFDKAYFEANLFGFNVVIRFYNFFKSVVEWFIPSKLRQSQIDKIGITEKQIHELDKKLKQK